MSNRKDLPSVNSPNFLARVRETLQGYLGSNGSVLDRGVTVRDLADSGIVKVNPTFLSSGVGSPIVGVGPAVGSGTGGGTTTVVIPGGPTAPAYVPDYTVPPAPTGFFAGAGLTHIQGAIATPTYTVGHGHDRSKLYGVTWAAGPLPTFNDATELMEFTGAMFAYPTNASTTWHLWVTHVSKDGVESAPTAGVNGLVATTGQNVSLLLSALSGQISSSQLAQSVTDEIEAANTTAGNAYSLAGTAGTVMSWHSQNYVVRTSVSVDGRVLVGGFGLMGGLSQFQGPTIDFGVVADRFWIGAPEEAGVTAVPSVKPFIVQTTSTVVNGVTIPKGVYMDAAFIVNLEAAVARLGEAWIGTAMMMDASITNAKIADLNAEKITAGQLSAERIDGRGLLIKNEEGATLLDARGNAVPPWVVQLTGLQDPGSISLAGSPDAANRARIRGIKVDGVTLKAQLSGSGNTIEMSTPGTEVWHKIYAAPVALEANDFRELDQTRFIMEPNTYYRFEITPLVQRATTDTTVTFHMLPPVGATGFLPSGVGFSLGEQMYQILSLLATNVIPSPMTATTTSFFVRSGPSGGVMKFYASSNNPFYVTAWSRFRAFRFADAAIPVGSFNRVGTTIPFWSENKSLTPTFTIPSTAQPYDALWTVNVYKQGTRFFAGEWVAMSGPRVLFNTATGRHRFEVGLWSGPYLLGYLNQAGNIVNPMAGNSQIQYYVGDTACENVHGSFFHFDVAEIPEGEEGRWFLNVRCPSSSIPNAADMGFSPTNYTRTQLTRTPCDDLYDTAPNDLFVERSSLSSGPKKQPLQDRLYPFLPGATYYLEVEFFLDFMGEPVSEPKIVRIVVNGA